MIRTEYARDCNELPAFYSKQHRKAVQSAGHTDVVTCARLVGAGLIDADLLAIAVISEDPSKMLRKWWPKEKYSKYMNSSIG